MAMYSHCTSLVMGPENRQVIPDSALENLPEWLWISMFAGYVLYVYLFSQDDPDIDPGACFHQPWSSPKPCTTWQGRMKRRKPLKIAVKSCCQKHQFSIMLMVATPSSAFYCGLENAVGNGKERQLLCSILEMLKDWGKNTILRIR